MNTQITKTQLAKDLGVSRTSLYYKPQREILDLEIQSQIKAVQQDHPAYGHKRIAMELKLNKKRIRRVMKKYGMKPYRRRTKQLVKPEDRNKSPTHYENLIKNICPIRSNIIWATDFTYIKYKGKFIYLATILDIYTREIVGWNITRFHNRFLVLVALKDALKRIGTKPMYLHSDQGSEYDSEDYIKYVEGLKIQISMSRKASPWENGYQESFYKGFKIDLGDQNRYEDLSELIEGIHQTIWYYNNKRIHTALKMPPIKFKEILAVKFIEYLSKEMGT